MDENAVLKAYTARRLNVPLFQCYPTTPGTVSNPKNLCPETDAPGRKRFLVISAAKEDALLCRISLQTTL